MEKLKELLLGYGYNYEEINIIIKSYPLEGYTEDTLCKKVIEKYNFMINLGYSNEDII